MTHLNIYLQAGYNEFCKLSDVLAFHLFNSISHLKVSLKEMFQFWDAANIKVGCRQHQFSEFSCGFHSEEYRLPHKARNVCFSP